MLEKQEERKAGIHALLDGLTQRPKVEAATETVRFSRSDIGRLVDAMVDAPRVITLLAKKFPAEEVGDIIEALRQALPGAVTFALEPFGAEFFGDAALAKERTLMGRLAKSDR